MTKIQIDDGKLYCDEEIAPGFVWFRSVDYGLDNSLTDSNGYVAIQYPLAPTFPGPQLVKDTMFHDVFRLYESVAQSGGSVNPEAPSSATSLKKGEHLTVLRVNASHLYEDEEGLDAVRALFLLLNARYLLPHPFVSNMRMRWDAGLVLYPSVNPWYINEEQAAGMAFYPDGHQLTYPTSEPCVVVEDTQGFSMTLLINSERLPLDLIRRCSVTV